MMDAEALKAVVADAMLAPSAHNTQPVRWSLDGPTIVLSADLGRRLNAGDPDDRDLMISCGAAIESTVLALATRQAGGEVTMIADTTVSVDGPSHLPFARINLTDAPVPSDVELAAYQHARTTHRGGFLPVSDAVFANWKHPHLKLVQLPKDVAWLAKQVDLASARMLRNRALRQELLDWMRLESSHPRYHVDGLNRETLYLDVHTAWMVRPVLGTWMFDALSAIGLGPTLSGEQARTKTASALAIFHWPTDGSLFDAGRAFYRMWLEATQRDLTAWPAAALADDPMTAARLATRFRIPKDRAILNVLRLGLAHAPTPQRTRLSVPDAII